MKGARDMQDLEGNLSNKQNERRVLPNKNQRRLRTTAAVTFFTATALYFMPSDPVYGREADQLNLAFGVEKEVSSDQLFSVISSKRNEKISITEMLSQIEEKERQEKEKEERLLEAKAEIKRREVQRVQAAALRTSYIEAQKKEENERKERQRKTFSSVANEEYLLAQIIELEAAKFGNDRIYSGSVVLNRVRTTYIDFRYVHTISEVFYQGGHYAPETRAKIGRCIPSAESVEVAHGLITGEIPVLEEKILYQTSTKKAWMYGFTGDANLPDAVQYYGYPLDFEKKCL